MKAKLWISLIMAGMLYGMTTPAFSLVTFDPVKGTGYIPRSDLKLLLGWNDSMLRNNLMDLAFAFKSVDTYEVVVEWGTGKTKYQAKHIITVPRYMSINCPAKTKMPGVAESDGITLTGCGAIISESKVPRRGEYFSDGNEAHPITSVRLIASTGIGLSVSYADNTYPLCFFDFLFDNSIAIRKIDK
ncbi:MAG: hypothetical protein WCE64_15665 [Bacteroidales bacterium]